MTPQEIIEGNKLIAEFMGYDGVDCPNCKHTRDCNWLQCGLTPHEKDEQLKYHSSWDWLMPVVEKISDICKANNSELYVKFYNGTRKELLIFRHTKDETWTLCVDFIEWYNQNKASEETKSCPNCKETKQPYAYVRTNPFTHQIIKQ